MRKKKKEERKGKDRKLREGKGSKEGMKTKRKNWKRYEKEEEVQEG